MQQTIMITGATSGIGREVARQLAAREQQIVIVGRNEDKARETVSALRQETGNFRVDYLLADFSSLDQVRSLADRFQKRYQRLDVLVNNAGAFFLRRQESVDSYEMTFAVNHLAPFLLTNHLLPTMRASVPARIINVASDAHEGASLDFDNLQYEQGYSGMKAYGRSKLANILFSNEFARCLEGTGVTSNAMHPGFVSTGMGTNNLPGWAAWIVPRITGLFGRDVAKGAETIVFLAASGRIEGVNGGYFVDMNNIPPSANAQDQAAAHRLWQISAQMTNLPPHLSSRTE